jgi:hypothetical protein
VLLVLFSEMQYLRHQFKHVTPLGLVADVRDYEARNDLSANVIGQYGAINSSVLNAYLSMNASLFFSCSLIFKRVMASSRMRRSGPTVCHKRKLVLHRVTTVKRTLRAQFFNLLVLDVQLLF